MNDLTLTLHPIAVIHTPYKEKFSVPSSARFSTGWHWYCGTAPPYNSPEAVRGLEQFSHLWLIFQFDKVPHGKWQSTVRPPRLGGNQRVGVFASRATHRPNPLGLSKVELRQVECIHGRVFLHLGSVDLVDGTPILILSLILPMLIVNLRQNSSFAQEKPPAKLNVEFTEIAQSAVEKYHKNRPHLARFITEVIAQDPSPGFINKVKKSIVFTVLVCTNLILNGILKAGTTDCVEILDIQKLKNKKLTFVSFLLSF